MSVLLAEDDSDIREILAEVLRAEGFEVLEASNGLEALRLASAHQPDVIVTDLMMPVMDGRELIAAVKRKARLADVPVMVITAYHNRTEGLAADRLLPKPFELETFTAAIRELTYPRPEATA